MENSGEVSTYYDELIYQELQIQSVILTDINTNIEKINKFTDFELPLLFILIFVYLNFRLFLRW